jgi:hypothetical protein
MAEGDSKGYLFLMRRLLLAVLTFFFSSCPRVSLLPQLGILSGLRVDLRIYNNRCGPESSVAASPIPAIRVICTCEAADPKINNNYSFFPSLSDS